jgi:hypothetical protein
MAYDIILSPDGDLIVFIGSDDVFAKSEMGRISIDGSGLLKLLP